MALHVIRFVLTIIDSDFAAAAVARGIGEQNVNPLQLALRWHASFHLVGYSPQQLYVKHVGTYRQYSGPVSDSLAEYMERFKAGKFIAGDHAFELTLSSDDPDAIGCENCMSVDMGRAWRRLPRIRCWVARPF